MTSPLRRQKERGFVSIKVRAEATRGKPHSAIIIGMTILAGVMSPQQTYAVDVDPGDYIALPAGTNLALQYLQFSHDNSYWSPTTGRVGGRLDSEIGLFRFVHYTKLFGFTIDPQFIIPFGTINNVRIGKGSLNSSIGVGDPIVGSTFWAVNKPDTQTYLGITPLLTIPVGTYSSRKSINIGNNRWSGDLQVGFQTAFAKTGQPGKIRLQIWGDGYFYGNNNRYSGHNTLSQNNVWQLQTWISYDLDKTQNFSAGMDAVWGGKAYVDNIKGAGSRRTAIRFEYQKFFARRFQIVGEATHDVVSAGGFRQKIGINARMLYAF